ncbi:hypothetical protein D9619_007866 [Psilocybe cf. subviscida]|uniref:Uncharacterized protein n=1 Tax=Psilocybe cf. subviscida TaxID=2480587 RepID=A0A8H5ESA8_9AGAR|nr:hypothetical protein D9619_007866 [Psilocybe cf. subviscida]
MTTPVARNIGSRGTTMAIACGTAIVATLGGMYFTGRDVKSKEGQASPYGNQDHPKGDKAMTSSEVAAAVSVPKPTDKDRLPAGIPNKADA